MTNKEIITYLESRPDLHQLFPSADSRQLDQYQHTLGPMPDWLRELLEFTNGAELFLSPDSSIVLFSLQSNQPRGELFPDEWFIIPYTQRWRAAGERPGEWAWALTNYGGLLIAKPDGSVMEWDTKAAEVLQRWPSHRECFDWIVAEGEASLE